MNPRQVFEDVMNRQIRFKSLDAVQFSDKLAPRRKFAIKPPFNAMPKANSISIWLKVNHSVSMENQVKHKLLAVILLVAFAMTTGCKEPVEVAKPTKPVAAKPSPMGSYKVSGGPVLGTEAPEIVGVDLDGVEFKLSDYRGKVVMLDFYGDW